jgi:hypothetical protein
VAFGLRVTAMILGYLISMESIRRDADVAGQISIILVVALFAGDKFLEFILRKTHFISHSEYE